MSIPRIIAIDGPAASGKSTLAEKLADHLDYLYFDTGVMYRAVTLAALTKLGSVDEEVEVSNLANQIKIDVQSPTIFDGRKYDVLIDRDDVTWQIREPDIDANVSLVSTYAGVRKAMTEQQRRIGSRGNVVMVGRDIGTVVFPDAELKIYLDASSEERARRRFLEIQQRGGNVPYKEVLDAIKKRDNIDTNRDLAPLKIADDAVVIMSDGMQVSDILNYVLGMLE